VEDVGDVGGWISYDLFLDSEWSDEYIGFTMMCVFSPFGEVEIMLQFFPSAYFLIGR